MPGCQQFNLLGKLEKNTFLEKKIVQNVEDTERCQHHFSNDEIIV